MSLEQYTSFQQSLLPLQRMQALLDEGAASQYQQASPYSHIAIDNFFDPAILDKVLEEFPNPKDIDWKENINKFEIKLGTRSEKDIGLFSRYLMYTLNSSSFLEFLQQLTGIENLIPDPSLIGGGLHQIKRGGKLGIHADFNKHKDYDLDRRINILIYLNKDWLEEYGGHFELWNHDMSQCEQKVLPIFNRLVIFSTSDFSYHGHPDPLQCPADRSRKSMALYYYTNGQPEAQLTNQHNTLFKQRPGETLRLPLRLRLSRRFNRLRKKLARQS